MLFWEHVQVYLLLMCIFFSDYKKAHYFQGMDFNLNVCFHHFGVLGVTQRIKVIQVISKQILL